MFSQIPGLYLRESPRGGRGVFTSEPIPAESIIEICPVIILSPADRERIHTTRLHDYYFLWGQEGHCAIALGFGSLYNHSDLPNADFGMDFERETIEFYARRDILVGEEIVVSYTGAADPRAELWFTPRE